MKQQLKESMGRKPTDQDVQFAIQKGVVLSLRSAISEFRGYKVFHGPLRVLQCLCYLLGFKKEQVADRKNIPEWPKIRKVDNGERFSGLMSSLLLFDVIIAVVGQRLLRPPVEVRPSR